MTPHHPVFYISNRSQMCFAFVRSTNTTPRLIPIGHHVQQNRFEASIAYGHLNRETKLSLSPVSVRASEFGLARQVRTSRPASPSLTESAAYSQVPSPPFSVPRRSRHHTINRHQRVSPELNQVTQLHTGGVRRRESSSTRPVVVKVAQGNPVHQFICAFFFPTPNTVLQCSLANTQENRTCPQQMTIQTDIRYTSPR